MRHSDSVATHSDGFHDQHGRSGRRLHELSELTFRVEAGALGESTIEENHRFVQLYLDEASRYDSPGQHEQPGEQSATLTLARAHSALFRPLSANGWPSLVRALRRDFPDALVRERLPILAALALFVLGGLLGAFIVESDNDALSVVLPEVHQAQEPLERVRADLQRHEFDAFRALEFASFLFTHNIEVAFLLFALGLTCGFGTAVALIWNGVPIGALAAQYHASGLGTFFWAWIMPHGVLELGALAIAGGAGFVLARALVRPGRATVSAALSKESRSAVVLVLGAIPMLIVAGVIEGTLSQMHGAMAPAPAKFAVAVLSLLSFVFLVARRRA